MFVYTKVQLAVIFFAAGTIFGVGVSLSSCSVDSGHITTIEESR